jgi:hypothetical protein
MNKRLVRFLEWRKPIKLHFPGQKWERVAGEAEGVAALA